VDVITGAGSDLRSMLSVATSLWHDERSSPSDAGILKRREWEPGPKRRVV